MGPAYRISVSSDDLESIQSAIADLIPKGDGFLGGRLGLAYYYYNTYKMTGAPGCWELTMSTLSEIYTRIGDGNATVATAAFSSGMAGLGFVHGYLHRHGFPDSLELAGMPGYFDDFLIGSACDMIKAQNVDFLHGAVGILHYYASLPASDDVLKIMNHLVPLLLSNAMASPDGIWWPNSALSEGAASINLSLSHGQCGIVLVLLNILQKYGDRWALEDHIRKGISFIVATTRDLSAQRPSLYPYAISMKTGEAFVGNRLAWCYGDLNVALVLIRAGTLLDVEAWKRESDRIGISCTRRRSSDDTSVSDAHFCHGSAGLVYFFRALYRLTGREDYLESYYFWTIRTAGLSRTDKAMGRFPAHGESLLEGWPGIGLTLMSAKTGWPMPWGEAFLLC